jgi:hypothetical protein
MTDYPIDNADPPIIIGTNITSDRNNCEHSCKKDKQPAAAYSTVYTIYKKTAKKQIHKNAKVDPKLNCCTTII